MTFPDSRTQAGLRRAARAMARGVASCLPWRLHRLASIALIGGLMMLAAPVPAFSQSLGSFVAGVLETLRAMEAEAGSILSHAPLRVPWTPESRRPFRSMRVRGIEYTARAYCDVGCTEFDARG